MALTVERNVGVASRSVMPNELKAYKRDSPWDIQYTPRVCWKKINQHNVDKNLHTVLCVKSKSTLPENINTTASKWKTCTRVDRRKRKNLRYSLDSTTTMLTQQKSKKFKSSNISEHYNKRNINNDLINSIAIVDTSILPIVDTPAFGNRRTLARLHNEWMRKQPDLAGTAESGTVVRTVAMFNTLYTGDDWPYKKILNHTLRDIACSVCHILFFSHARMRYNPSAIEGHLLHRRQPQNITNEPDLPTNRNKVLRSCLSPSHVSGLYNRSVDHFTLHTITLARAVSGVIASDNSVLFPPSLTINRDGMPVHSATPNKKEDDTTQSVIVCPHIMPSLLLISHGPLCNRCMLKLKHSERVQIRAKFSHKRRTFEPSKKNIKPRKRALKLSEIFPTVDSWYPGCPVSVNKQNLQNTMLPILPNVNPLSLHRRRTNIACVTRLSDLLSDNVASFPRKLCLKLLNTMPIGIFDKLVNIAISTWNLFRSHLRSHMRFLNYQFNYHVLLVFYHAVFGVYTVRSECFQPCKYNKLSTTQPTLPQTAIPPRYVHAIEIIPSIPVLSGCLPYSTHLDQFKFSLASVGECHGLFQSALMHISSTLKPSSLHHIVCLDVNSICPNTLMLDTQDLK